MTREELMSMLDLPAEGESDLEVSEAEDRQNKPVEVSPTALKLDEWGLRRGRDVLAESEVLRKSLEVEDPSYVEGDEWKDACRLTSDFHGAAFEPEPSLAEACANDRLHGYMKALLDTPEFKSLHQETMLDETASEIAAASFAKGWMDLAHREPEEDEFKREIQCIRHAVHSLDEAQQEVKDLRSAQDAMGIGHQEIGQVFKRVRNSHHLKRICELAGRYRRLAQAKQRQKVLHGRDDVVGVVLDGDVGSLLPHELASLDDPDLELDTMRRIVERQAMCRDYRGVEQVARGPIVVVVDESGSMSGEPVWTAKAIALALAWVARQQNRFVCLVGFAGATEGNFLVIPPGKTDDAALMDWLEHFFGGGTDCDVPLDVLPSRWDELGCPKGKTDIVCVTDAIVRVPPGLRASFLAWKASEQVKMISLIVNSEPGDLALVSDRTHQVSSLSIEEEAVGEVLSV